MIKKAKFLTMVVIFSLVILLSYSVESSSQGRILNNLGGEVEDIFVPHPSLEEYEYITALRNHIVDQHMGKDNLNVYQIPVYEVYDERGNLIVKFEHNVPVSNLSQTSFNTSFNHYLTLLALNGGDVRVVDGTCTQVAVTMLINYYGDVKNHYELENREITYTNRLGLNPQTFVIGNQLWQVFGAVHEIGIAQGVMWSDTSGTLNTSHERYINYTMDRFGSNNVSSTSLSVYPTIKAETSEGRPVMFNITQHTIVARGYVRFFVQYTETTGALWWKTTVTHTKTVDYIIVNNGYRVGVDKYGYLAADKTTTGNLLYNAQSINESD